MSVDVSTTDHVDKLDLNDKKKTLLRGCVMTKCQPTGGRSGGERPPGF